jgi:hypothetical protein
MQSLIIASFVALFSLGCGAEQDVASVGQELALEGTDETARPQCTTNTCGPATVGLWCLGKCTVTGPAVLHVVAHNPTCGDCADLLDTFCKRRALGPKIYGSACWGTVR